MKLLNQETLEGHLNVLSACDGARCTEVRVHITALHQSLLEAIALLREWGTSYGDPQFQRHPPYGERIGEFLERVGK